VLVDANRPQCSSDADCTARGPDFQDAVCQESICVVQPTRWSCLKTDGPAMMTISGEFAVSFRVRDTVSQQPKMGVTARACRRLDVSCAKSVGEVGTTDENGNVELRVPGGFDGYVRFESSEIAPTLYFFDPPVQANQHDLTVSVNTPETAVGLAALTGATPDGTLGVVLVTVYDCFAKPADGVIVTPGEVGDSAKMFYVRNGLPSTTAKATDDTGYAGIVNAAPGTITVSAATNDATIGSVTVLVQSGTQTLAHINPNGT